MVYFSTYRGENKTSVFYIIIYIHNKDYCSIHSLVCNDSHSSVAFLCHRVAGADVMWSIAVPCSQSTDITSLILTSWVFKKPSLLSPMGLCPVWQSQIVLLNR